MRKIENEIIKAVIGKKTVKLSSRDYVEFKYGLSNVYLHGHKIAVYNHADNILAFTFAGWGTVTTKSRVNALLSVFACGKCSVSNFVLYYETQKISVHKWYKVNTKNVMVIEL